MNKMRNNNTKKHQYNDCVCLSRQFSSGVQQLCVDKNNRDLYVETNYHIIYRLKYLVDAFNLMDWMSLVINDRDYSNDSL